MSRRRSEHNPGLPGGVIRHALVAVTICGALLGVVAGPASARPVNNVLPVVRVENEAAIKLGSRLICAAESWTGFISKFEYEWFREGQKVGIGVTYVVGSQDKGRELWCVVIAVEGSDRVQAVSANGVIWGERAPEFEAPINKTAPQVSGNAEVGATLTCSQGTWTGNPAPTFTYQWLRDETVIAGATASTYKTSGADGGHAIACAVTGTNSVRSNEAQSFNSLSIPGNAPRNLKLPSVLGLAEAGKSVTCSEGEWEGSPPLSFKFQWLRNGTAIASAIGGVYLIAAADEGQSLACQVTATNGSGSKTAASQSRIVRISPPVNTVAPAVEGPAEVGATLSCAPGTWSGANSFQYEWLRGATVLASRTNSYTVAEADRGAQIACVVTARNGGGEASRQSAPFVIPQGGGSGRPVALGRPVVSGIAQAGSPLTCAPGSWSNEPTEFVLQWVRDAGSASEVAIEAADESDYEVTAADEGHDLACRVTAINLEGSATAESEPLGVSGRAPLLLSAPSITGRPQAGESLTCLHGEWSAAPPPSFAYSWRRDGAQISTGYAYVVGAADRGHSLTCTVTATNSEAPAGVTAETSAVYVSGAAPRGPAPAVLGSPEVGQSLTCSEGAWSGAPTPAFSYEWLLSGVAIPGASQQAYTVTTPERGLALSCTVTATNREGTASAASPGVRVIGVRPSEVEAPRVTGAGVAGGTLTCERGVWKGAPPPVFSYQWLRDGTAIAGATGATYAVEASDQGHALACTVTATNVEGAVEVESSNTVAVTAHESPAAVTTAVATGEPAATISDAAILTSLRGQVRSAQGRLRLGPLVKSGGFSFTFVASVPGTLELLWQQPAKPAHGASKKTKPISVASMSTPFTSTLRKSVRMKLTATGLRLLKGGHRVSLLVKAVFRGTHRKAVTWTGTVTLSR
jgi:hypothetical protein